MRAILAILVVWGLGNAAQADIYVYQLPGGARIVADHPLNNRDYRLVRHSRTAKGAGTLVSSRTIAYAVTDPTAYDRLIRRTATAHQVDASLVKAVMHIESAFNPHAVSHKGAQGLMQLMPDTAQRYGAYDLFDPVQNVRAGVKYLKDLQKLFKNNTRLVLAAYNAGENAVLRYKGIPPYSETQDYVRKVIKVHQRYAAAEHSRTRVAHAAVPAARKLVSAPEPVISSNMAPASATPLGVSGFIPVASVQPTSITPPDKSL
jgi:Transglycosylase SLT domain